MDNYHQQQKTNAIDKRKDRQVQALDAAHRRFAPKLFIARSQRVDPADIRSVERVWRRLEEHVSSEKSTDGQGKPLTGLWENDEAWSNENEPTLRSWQKRGRLQKSLEMVATLCLVALLVGSLIVVLRTAQQTHGSQSASSQTTTTPPASNQLPSKAVTITIDEGKNGATIGSSTLKLPARSLLIWNNQTTSLQVIVCDTNAFGQISLGVHEQSKQLFKKAGRYTFHLQSNPRAIVVVTIFGVPPSSQATVVLVPSASSQSVQLQPSMLKLSVGTTLVWLNKTNQEQVLISESNSKNFSLAPRTSVQMLCNNAGTYSWYMLSNPKARVVVVVMDV